ncbi:hypothetical protein BV25DRAFT_1820469 [Artomyces pyxidatus]|uniref:Uncharacterized protein n=1 Tax=Artomyces pyxidatus TaxID=48021 RepID=A0ACB8TDL5_9AGAM|nr:hypothetical protein BV25DRAFT_1820469 [Artomyces pyxidatus]
MTTSSHPTSSLSFTSTITSTLSSPSQNPNQFASADQSVCLGHGLDASVDGLLATIVLSGVTGLLLWLLFAILRPRFRQVYGLREWFVPEAIRPKALHHTFWAFLFPHVPLVPSITHDTSDAGQSLARDARIFPSDEELSQRTLWFCLLLVLGWSILGLAGALPLYLVSTPCLSQSANAPIFTGFYSTLQDLSLLRLLQLLDDKDITTSPSRAIVNGKDVTWRTRVRVIILTVIVIVLGVWPMLWKILKEFSKLAAYRRRWLDIHLQGHEMGWLSVRHAPGFANWGEIRLKDFITKTGLTSSLNMSPNASGTGARRANGRAGRHNGFVEEADLQVDIQSLFSIGDTQQLALLIEERDEILENLEIAETRYISSFRVSTPEPSIADLQPPQSIETEGLSHISRPRPLGSSSQGSRRRRRGRNPAYASSSLSPTSYVAPSQYYKLGNVRGVNGGRLGDDEDPGTSFTDSVNQRVVGTRFQEVNRNSVAFGQLPLGSHVRLESGVIDAVSHEHEASSPIPDPRHHGPNYVEHSSDTEAYASFSDEHHMPADTPLTDLNFEDVLSADWVDIAHEAPIDFTRDSTPPTAVTPQPLPERTSRASLFRFVRRPKIFGPTPSEYRETFPLRSREASERASDVPPPHLRVQRHPPFVRPLTGLDHEDLGMVYADIRLWRTKLKSINQEIALAQADAYNDIADGARVRGWLMVGRGLRFIPGMQLIEGRAKEDVRWDILQSGWDVWNKILFWTTTVTCAILLLFGLLAASGLAVATAPDFAHYIPFFQPLAKHNSFTTGLATVLAPAVGATIFIVIAMGVLNLNSRAVGSISVAAGQLLVMKAVFYIVIAVGAVWLVVSGAILFAFGSLSRNSQRTTTIADGSIYISVLVLAIVINLALIAPALLMLQPFRLRHVLRAEKAAVTPRQRFRAVYPRTYNPLFAMGSCILALAFASTFTFIFPLVGPAVTLLLFLTLIAHRYLVGYVYGRTRSQTGGLLQLWLLKRFGTLLAFQPLLLGLILLSRRLWPEGGVLVGSAAFIVVFVESFCAWKLRRPGRKSLSPITASAVDTFAKAAKPGGVIVDEERDSLVPSSGRAARTRGSLASVLDMMSVTLAVTPSPYQLRGPVPLQTETLDDLTATERAARTHPDAPPRLPPLPFADHAEEMSSILYAPELIAPPPIIWLPNDAAGVARAEAYDLRLYHELRATLDVRAREDVMPHRPLSFHGQHPAP